MKVVSISLLGFLKNMQNKSSEVSFMFLLYDFLQVFFFRAFVLKHSPSVVLGVSHLVKPSC